ncbi:hypothetical protein BJ912DRAFT_941621 [Pholiota molesta]|nr:hypothetical protein BJ912DRAFT_941621 [Pholiota molesta]
MDTDAAARGQGVFVNMAGFVYASFGFSLSVIAALLNLLFYSFNAEHEHTLTLPPRSKPAHPPRPHARSRQSIRSLSEHPIKVLSDVPEPSSSGQGPQASPSEKKRVIFHQHSLPSTPVKITHHTGETTAIKQLPEPPSKGRGPHCHGRSRSIPTMMVDHFDSTEHISRTSPDSSQAEPRMSGPIAPLPQPQSLVSPPSVQTTSTTKSNSICSAVTTARPKPRLFDPKSWGKDKRLKRCQSSPQLCKPPEMPFITSLSHKSTGSDPDIATPPAAMKKSKSWKTLHKAKSGPINDTSPKVDRKSEKKRSQTLRTHPYEAPYFAPPPVPSLPVHITFISDHTSSEYSSSIDSSPKSSLDRRSSRLFRAKS